MLDPFLAWSVANSGWLMNVLMVVASIAAGLAAWFMSGWMATLMARRKVRAKTTSQDALASFVATRALSEEEEDRTFRPHDLVMQSMNIKAAWARPWHIHVVVMLVISMICTVLGVLTHLTVLLSFIGLVVSQRFLSARWNAYIRQLETQLPMFLTQVSSNLATSGNFLEALNQCASPDSDQAVDRYFRQLLTKYQQNGPEFLGTAIRQAQHFSRPLVTTLYLLQRTEQTGGSDYLDSLRDASRHMMELQDSRVELLVQGSRGRSILMFLLVILSAIIFGMIQFNPSFNESYQNPGIMMVGIALAGFMIFGYFLMERIVDLNLKA